MALFLALSFCLGCGPPRPMKESSESVGRWAGAHPKRRIADSDHSVVVGQLGDRIHSRWKSFWIFLELVGDVDHVGGIQHHLPTGNT